MIKHICNSTFVSSVIASPSFDYTLVVSGFHLSVSASRNFPLCRRQQDIVEYLEGSCRPRFSSDLVNFPGERGARDCVLAITSRGRMFPWKLARRGETGRLRHDLSFPLPPLFSYSSFFLTWSVVIGACVIDRFLIKLLKCARKKKKKKRRHMLRLEGKIWCAYASLILCCNSKYLLYYQSCASIAPDRSNNSIVLV